MLFRSVSQSRYSMVCIVLVTMNSCYFPAYLPGTLLIPNDYQLMNAKNGVFWGMILSNYRKYTGVDEYYDVLLNGESTGFYVRLMSRNSIQDLFVIYFPLKIERFI